MYDIHIRRLERGYQEHLNLMQRALKILISVTHKFPNAFHPILKSFNPIW